MKMILAIIDTKTFTLILSFDLGKRYSVEHAVFRDGDSLNPTSI